MQNRIRYTCKSCARSWEYDYEVSEEQKTTYNVIFFERVVSDENAINDIICRTCDKSAEAELLTPMPQDKRTLVRVRLLMEIVEEGE